jgi:hypothetical protein
MLQQFRAFWPNFSVSIHQLNGKTRANTPTSFRGRRPTAAPPSGAALAERVKTA